MHSMDWDTLRHVLALARAGSLQGASGELGVARTTVSRRIAALETQLGTRLFYRTPDGWTPTSAGEELIEVAEQVEHDLRLTEERLRGQDHEMAGPLHVSTVPFLVWTFRDALARFSADHPEVQLSVSTTSERRAPGLRDADVVTRLSNDPPQTLVGRRIGPVQFGVYASAALTRRLGEHAPLAAYPWIGRAGGENVAWFEQWLAHHAPGARIVMRMEYEPMLLARLVRDGIGAQILPCILGDADPDLRRIAPLDPVFRLDLWVLTSAALRRNARIHSLVQQLAEAFAARREELAGGTDGR